ncbi:replication-relaxation family protein [Nocardiopsis quinghaiensis]|uniref:replication-relaxation family protein n=1 Tax=Nocardiopsis quinghaiensis TaxID=464995 RepID=UPI0016803B81|nr:replication-relaxation family protein [Nocardiopsis quinghaiensis]
MTPLKTKILINLTHHRLATTSQLKRLIQPQAAHPHYLRKALAQLRTDGLVDRVFRPQGRDHVWFTTQAGTELAHAHGGAPERSYQMDASRAQGPLQQHALAVVETGLAFLEHGRRHGRSLGPLSWTPEVAHRYRSGKSFKDSTLITDAVLDYVHVEGSSQWDLSYFIEVDRATMPVHRLVDKINAYQCYATYTPGIKRRGRRLTIGDLSTRPAWERRYRWFPILLFVLTAPYAAVVLRNRQHALQRMTPRWAYHGGDNPTLKAGVVLLSDLQQHGPAADIVVPLHYDSEDERTSIVFRSSGD